MAIEFKLIDKHISYKGDSCVRNDYAHNECTACIDMCPKDVLSIKSERFVIEKNACVDCAACLGVCPTEALTLEAFDTNAFILGFDKQETHTLSCKSNTKCLAGFDAKQLVTMALRQEAPVVCDMSHCATCELDHGKTLSEFIQRSIDSANDYIQKLGLDKHIDTILDTPQPKGRFAAFKGAFTTISSAASLEHATKLHAKTNTTVLKDILFRNALKSHMRDIPQTTIDDEHGFFTNIVIDFNTCTNCQECTQFCPTHALFATEDKQGIVFNGSQCVGCGICHEVCKVEAIASDTHMDIVNFVYERTHELVHYEMALCLECKCAYPYKGGEQICDRCKDHVEELTEMFTLARDM